MPTRRHVLQLVGASLLAHCLPSPAIRTSRWAKLAGDAWARVLASYVSHTGWVDYSGLRNNPDDLHRFIAAVTRLSPENDVDEFPTPADRMAYWINAYNAMVMSGILQHFPLRRVTEIGLIPRISFYDFAHFVAGGRAYSLEEIEHSILLGRYDDVRVIFALSNGSRSGARLRRQPYSANRLNAQLDAAAVSFLTDPQHAVWDPATHTFWLSPLLMWHQHHILRDLRQSGVTNPTLLDYLRWYVPAEDLPAPGTAVHIRFLETDWRLNGN